MSHLDYCNLVYRIVGLLYVDFIQVLQVDQQKQTVLKNAAEKSSKNLKALMNHVAGKIQKRMNLKVEREFHKCHLQMMT